MDPVIEFFQLELLGLPLWTYLFSLISILLGFLAKKIVQWIFRRLVRLTEKSKLKIDDVFVVALSRPCEWATVLAGLYLALSILPLPSEPLDVKRFTFAVLTSIFIALIIWVATRLVEGLTGIWGEQAKTTETKLDDQLVPIVRRSLKVFMYIIGVVLILQNLGYSVGSLIAGLGLSSLGLALASKDTAANLFGSVVIFLDKPFQIGDWIEVGDVEGTVEDVGLRTTRVRTFANSLVTVPNSLFTTSSVNNWSQMKKRRIKMTIGVTYDASPEKIDRLVKEIRQIIEDDQDIRSDFYLVNFDHFGVSSLDIFIYCFTITTNWSAFLEAKQTFMLKIMYCVKNLGLSFAFPTQTVHVESIPGEGTALSKQRPQ